MGRTCLPTHTHTHYDRKYSVDLEDSQPIVHFAPDIKLSDEFNFSPEWLGNGLDDLGSITVEVIFLVFKTSRQALRPTQHPVGTGSFFRGVKRPEREADYSPPPSTEVRNERCSAPSPPCMSSGRIQGQLFLVPSQHDMKLNLNLYQKLNQYLSKHNWILFII